MIEISNKVYGLDFASDSLYIYIYTKASFTFAWNLEACSFGVILDGYTLTDIFYYFYYCNYPLSAVIICIYKTLKR